jgi:hypothetical protein
MMQAADRVRWFSRRAFLVGGAGAFVALPALHSLMPRTLWAQAPALPKRFLAWFFPCGVPSMNDWRPAGAGASWEPSLLLSGLAPVKQHVSVISGLQNRGRGPDHSYGTSAFLTGRLFNDQGAGGPSIDQVIADGLKANGVAAPLHSLQLGINDKICEPGARCGTCDNISYTNGGNAITKQTDPAAAFDSLFAGFDPGTDDGGAAAAAAAERRVRRKSVLDAVLADATRLKPTLSATDQLRLEEYLDSVRSTEQGLAAMTPGGGGPACAPPDGFAVEGSDIDAQITAHAAVMALAFECDITRVITFMAASGATGKSRDFPDYHLDITHRGDGDWQRKFRETVVWEVEKFAALVQRLSTKVEADGVTPILDNSALFFASEISDGDRHNHNDMPVLLAGGLGGAITRGQHVVRDGEWFADLFMYIAGSMGVQLDSFGEDGEGRISTL